MDNPYIRLTEEFNHKRLRAILASGQAVVLYRLAIMSKDGDWILAQIGEGREEVERLLDEERRAFIRKNEARLDRYLGAAARWSEQWPRVSKELAGLPLAEAHEIMVTWAAQHLPQEP